MRISIHIILILSCICVTRAQFVSGNVLLGVSSVFAGFFAPFDLIYCRWNECCDHPNWFSPNFTELKLTLQDKVYGQHLVNGPVLKHLKAHAKKDPSKALVLSFHGWTGTGKNYVSKLAVENLLTEGMKSKFVHLISATKEFPHEEFVQQYKDKLRDMVETAVKRCPRSVFIFDEMDKMPVGLIDTLKPYVDYHERLGGVDYRKATFFFLSNIGGNDIAQKTIEHWKNGLERDDITLKAMEEIIRMPAYNSEAGLFRSELVSKNLITAYIPFLPLERSHVKECIRDALIHKRYYRRSERISEAKVQEIADELTYYPKGVDVFSTTGCKRIHEKVDLVMEDIHDEL